MEDSEMGAEGKKKNSSEVIVEEWSGSSSSKLSRTATITSISIQRSGSRFSHVWRRILQAFVPEGFPSSVTPDYVPFQLWDSLQGLSTYIRTMLSTQALLSAIGVGEKSATVLGATFQGPNWNAWGSFIHFLPGLSTIWHGERSTTNRLEKGNPISVAAE